jgi:hypothetical protein
VFEKLFSADLTVFNAPLGLFPPENGIFADFK